MINPGWRFELGPRTPTSTKFYSGVLDHDQRRWYHVIAPTSYIWPNGEKGESDDDPNAIDILKKFLPGFSPSVNSITVDDKCLLSEAFCDPDYAFNGHSDMDYVHLSERRELQGCPTVDFFQLAEHDRLCPGVDLVSLKAAPDQDKKLVFKYGLTRTVGMRVLSEIGILRMLPPHPHIVPLNSIVTDGQDDPRALGFTTEFVPGRDLERNTERSFQLKWLKQLLSIIDFLNLEVGVTHSDICKRNLLIDPETDDLKVFDFGESERIESSAEPREIVAGEITLTIITVYEIVTHDATLRDDMWEEWEKEGGDRLHAALNIAEKYKWVAKWKLDCKLSKIRKCLKKWLKKRKALLDDMEASPKTDDPSSVNNPTDDQLPIYDDEVEKEDQGVGGSQPAKT